MTAPRSLHFLTPQGGDNGRSRCQKARSRANVPPAESKKVKGAPSIPHPERGSGARTAPQRCLRRPAAPRQSAPYGRCPPPRELGSRETYTAIRPPRAYVRVRWRGNRLQSESPPTDSGADGAGRESSE